jgi:hypothetical protein
MKRSPKNEEKMEIMMRCATSSLSPQKAGGIINNNE